MGWNYEPCNFQENPPLKIITFHESPNHLKRASESNFTMLTGCWVLWPVAENRMVRDLIAEFFRGIFFFFEGYQNPPETKKQRKVWGLVIWMIHSWVSLWKVQLDVETLRKLKLFQTRYTYLNLLSISCFHIIFDFCNRIFIARISKRSSELSWTLKILFILYLSIFFIFWNHAQQDQMSNVQSIPETSVVFLFSSKDMSLLKEIVLNSDFYAYIYMYVI